MKDDLMATKAHQLIAGVIARKMREKGYEIISFDGNEKIISKISLDLPPKIKKHRPDILGVNFHNKMICIGEAKTENDLKSKRTREEFQDFSEVLINEIDKKCELIIGIPKKAENLLRKILLDLNLLNKDNVSYVWVPEELIYEEEECI